MKSPSDQPNETTARCKSGSGKLVVLGIFGLAILMASLAVAWSMLSTRRALSFWGPANVQLIQRANRVELLQLELWMDNQQNRQSNEFLVYGTRTCVIKERRDVTNVRGLGNARHALTVDASFETDPMAADNAGRWSHAVLFSDGRVELTVLMDFSRRRFANYQAGREITVIPKIAEGWQGFVERQNP
jgi:hypothetical protein